MNEASFDSWKRDPSRVLGINSPEMNEMLAREIIGDRKIELTFDEAMALAIVGNPTSYLHTPVRETARLADLLNAAVDRTLRRAQVESTASEELVHS